MLLDFLSQLQNGHILGSSRHAWKIQGGESLNSLVAFSTSNGIVLPKKNCFIFSPIHVIPCSDFHEQMSSSSIQNKISVIFAIDVRFLGCVKNNSLSDYTKLYWAVLVIVSAISIMKLIIGMTESSNPYYYISITLYM